MHICPRKVPSVKVSKKVFFFYSICLHTYLPMHVDSLSTMAPDRLEARVVAQIPPSDRVQYPLEVGVH